MRFRADIVAFLSCSLVSAQGQELKLSTLISEALERNPEILAAQKKCEAARQRPRQVRSLPDPILSPGWSSNGNPLPGAGIGVIPTSNIGVSVTQEVPYPGKRTLRGEVASKEAEAEFAEMQIVELGVVSQVKQAFFRLQHSYAAQDVLERNRELLKKLLAVTEIAYSSGKAAQQDVFKAQIQLSLIETKLVQISRERRLREAELNRLLNRSSEIAYPKPADPHIGPISKTLAELQAAAGANSPLQLKEQKLTERAESAVNLARKDFYPDYALSAGYYNQAGMSPMYTFRADIRLPLWRGKQQAALTEQVFSLSEARHRFQATGQNLAFRIADDYSMAETSLQLVNLYLNTILPQARLTIDSSMASYETGSIDFLSVLNNYMAAYEYEMDYHEEMLNYHLALSRLEETSGVPLIGEDHQ
jgi:outer membrane protein TolC